MVPNSEQIRVGKQGRVVLPRVMRTAIHAEEGSSLVVWVEDDKIILTTPDVVRRRLRGRYTSKSPKGAVAELLMSRRVEAERE